MQLQPQTMIFRFKYSVVLFYYTFQETFHFQALVSSKHHEKHVILDYIRFDCLIFMCDVHVVQLLELSPLKRLDFISRVRIPLVRLPLSLFKPQFTRCISTLQVSCLVFSVMVRAFDSKCLELSIPGSNPTSAFDAGGYGGI